jgi:hypothetical protein
VCACNNENSNPESRDRDYSIEGVLVCQRKFQFVPEDDFGGACVGAILRPESGMTNQSPQNSAMGVAHEGPALRQEIEPFSDVPDALCDLGTTFRENVPNTPNSVAPHDRSCFNGKRALT